MPGSRLYKTNNSRSMDLTNSSNFSSSILISSSLDILNFKASFKPLVVISRMIRVFLSTFFESGEGDGATEEKDCFRFRISCPDSFLEVDEDDSLLEEFELEE